MQGAHQKNLTLSPSSSAPPQYLVASAQWRASLSSPHQIPSSVSCLSHAPTTFATRSGVAATVDAPTWGRRVMSIDQSMSSIPIEIQLILCNKKREMKAAYGLSHSSPTYSVLPRSLKLCNNTIPWNMLDSSPRLLHSFIHCIRVHNTLQRKLWLA